MTPKKAVATSLAEVKKRKTACAECRRRKKRCGHRDNLPSVSEAVVPPAVAADDNANAANVPDAMAAAAQVDAPIDDITAAKILMTLRYGSVPEFALEDDQGLINTTSASGAESSAAAPRDPADIPSSRPQTRLRIRAPRRPPRPRDNAAIMALNSSFSRQMAKKLEDFEAKYQASMAAHQAVMEAGKAVKDLSDWWLDTWRAQQE